jgi:hypothetical protein
VANADGPIGQTVLLQQAHAAVKLDVTKGNEFPCVDAATSPSSSGRATQAAAAAARGAEAGHGAPATPCEAAEELRRNAGDGEADCRQDIDKRADDAAPSAVDVHGAARCWRRCIFMVRGGGGGGGCLGVKAAATGDQHSYWRGCAGCLRCSRSFSETRAPAGLEGGAIGVATG